jgi:hypothetical protein
VPVRRYQVNKKRLASASLQVFFTAVFWCRLPGSNWPPDDYKSAKVAIFYR